MTHLSEIEKIVCEFLDVMKNLISKTYGIKEYNMSICVENGKYNYKVAEGGLYSLEDCKGKLIATFHTHPPNADEVPSDADIDVATFEKPHKYMCIGGLRGDAKYIKCWKVDEKLMEKAIEEATKYEPTTPEGDWTKYNEAYEKIHKPILKMEIRENF